ncbi:MAG: Hint domain-containing protein [Rhodospirillales bacterium]|nr:Hint domain-containing protein [Rhodospirillales bacterium]
MAGTISTTITHGIYEQQAASNPLTITDTGAILAGAADSSALSLASGSLWTVVNDGIISAATGYGIRASLGTIINQGLITAGGSYGIRLDGNTTLTDSVVVNSGTIIDTHAAPLPGFYAAIYIGRSGEVTNQAHGLISGANNGINNYALGTGPEKIVNAGTIVGATYDGISSSGKLTLSNSGLITGGAVGIVSSAYGGGSGSGNNFVTNVAGGVINGGVYGVSLTGLSTLTNAGVIGGRSAAVMFSAGAADRLIDDPGAVFKGKVSGGNAIGSGFASTLELAAGAATGTLVGLGTSTGFYDFAAVSVDAGAAWSLAGASTLAAGTTLADSGQLTLASAIAGTGTIAFAGAGITLTAEKGAVPTPTLAGFKNNFVDLVGVDETISSFGGGKLTLGGAAAITLAIAGTYTQSDFNAVYANGETVLTACYAEGTVIETADGPAAVEDLRPGMRLRTASGALRPVRWVGYRRHTATDVAARDELRPVRIAAGALGQGLPSRELRLSPEHALLLDGVLVPAIQLLGVPGIDQEPPGAVTYFNIELDTHDTILAEGVAAETFIEGSARVVFDNAETRPAPPVTIPCAPRIVSGPVLASIRRRLGAPDAERAAGTVVGHIESTAPGRIGGWAFQPEAPDAPVRLLIAADGVPCGTAVANGFRFDLRRAGLGHGQAAFTYTGPIPAGAHSVSVTRAGDGAHLPGSPFRVAA